ncbi:hypothetical protein HPB51_017214 [Rhipicephalus microplus]|uniref:Peptidase M13 N-terminal domain-containing protein n=1 Tax=Rhipicephalus microplus TaxID=6941 RepID=A0A9J6EAU2_RHIMP|nr:hypothetical protein HPB51_017214 [Rhipicephalus microplus]
MGWLRGHPPNDSYDGCRMMTPPSVSPDRGSPARASPGTAKKSPAGSAKSSPAGSPAAASPTHIPFWMQPHAANQLPPSREGTPAPAQPGGGGAVSSRVKTLTGKIMDMVSSNSSRASSAQTSPSPTRATSPRDSPGTRPRLMQFAKRLQVKGATAKGSPKRGFRGWFGGQRSAEEQQHDDVTKSFTNTLRRRVRNTVAVAVVIVLLCILMVAITWRFATSSWSKQTRGQGISPESNDSSALKRSGRSCAADASKGPCGDPYEALFLDSVDASASPCGNFYQYACGTWKHNHAATMAAEVMWKEFASNAIRRIREAKLSAFGTHNGPIGQAARFLESCLDVGRDASEGVESDLKAVLDEGGLTWPSRNERADFMSSLFFMARHVALPVFFGVEVGYTEDGQRALLFPLAAHFQRTFRRFREHMRSDRGKEDVRIACTMLTAGALNGARHADIVSALYQMTRVFDVYVYATDLEQQEGVSFLSQNAPSVPEEKWRSLLRRHFRYYFSDLEAVVVYNVHSFAGIFDALRKKGEALMSDVLGFLSVQAAIYYTDSRFRDVFFDSPGEAVILQEQYCFAQAYRFYEHALNHYLFQSDANTAASLEEFRNLAEGIRRRFPEFLNLRGGDTCQKSRHFVWEYFDSGGAGDHQAADCAGQCDSVYFRWRLIALPPGVPMVPSRRAPRRLACRTRVAGRGRPLSRLRRQECHIARGGVPEKPCLSRAGSPSLGASLDLGLQAAVAAVALAWRAYDEEAKRRTDNTLFADVGSLRASQVFFAFGCRLFCGD